MVKIIWTEASINDKIWSNIGLMQDNLLYSFYKSVTPGISGIFFTLRRK